MKRNGVNVVCFFFSYRDPVVVRFSYYKGMAETLNDCLDYTSLYFIDKYFGEIRAVAWKKQSKRMGKVIEVELFFMDDCINQFVFYFTC